MKNLKEFMQESLNEQDDSKAVKDKIKKEVKRIREALFDDAKMVDRLVNAMSDIEADKKDISKMKEAEKYMDSARKALTEIKSY